MDDVKFLFMIKQHYNSDQHKKYNQQIQDQNLSKNIRF